MQSRLAALLAQFQQFSLLDTALIDWLQALAIALCAYLLSHVLLQRIRKRALQQQQKSGSHLLAATLLASLSAIRHWLLALLFLVLAMQTLHLPEQLSTVLGHLAFALVGLQVALWCNRMIDLWLSRTAADSKNAGMTRLNNPVLASMLTWMVQLAIWATLLLAFLANIGVNITAFVASLGIGGVAVALGLQNILGDLFASIAIGIDKPFEVGDYIAFGSKQGTVTRVGVKTTRISALGGEQLIIANASLLDQQVHNYSRLRQRRVAFGFRLPYASAADEVQLVVERVNQLIQAEQMIRFDRGHLARLGEYGLEFEFVYYVLSADYKLYMDIQQRINLGIMNILSDLSLEFCVPTHDLRSPANPVATTATVSCQPPSSSLN